MIEYALIRDNRIVQILTSSRSQEEVARDWGREFRVVPLPQVPEEMLSEYRFWRVRP